ncbi:MAG: hypothetical protein AAF770_00170 [Bacteroidota bacterium]
MAQLLAFVMKDYPIHPKAVSFDSSGTTPLLEKMVSNSSEYSARYDIEQSLDITNYRGAQSS